jgi:hypothetical protein
MYLVFRKGIGGYYVKEMQPGMNKIALTASNENVLLNENRSKDTSSSFNKLFCVDELSILQIAGVI